VAPLDRDQGADPDAPERGPHLGRRRRQRGQPRRETARGGHAVALVGYTPDRFIVRNSWGTGWGDGGFAYASLAYAQDAFTEAYGASV
jgi:Papain family cysteine protease